MLRLIIVTESYESMCARHTNSEEHGALANPDRAADQCRLGQEDFCEVSIEGEVDFVRYHRGRKGRVAEDEQQWLWARVREQPDLTLAELQQRLAGKQKVQLSVVILKTASYDCRAIPMSVLAKFFQYL